MASLQEQREMWLDVICSLVAEGQTIRQIAKEIGVSAGRVIAIATSTPAAVEQYSRARDAAGDIFEADIHAAAEACTPETAAADRIRIDALKWIAARRAPKRYGDRVKQEISGPEGQPLEVGGAVLEALARKHSK